MTTRRVRLNNPGLIKRGIDWDDTDGLTDDQPDPVFNKFVNPVMGMRAMARILMIYQRRHSPLTVADLIGEWMSKDENNTVDYDAHEVDNLRVDYAAQVARKLGVEPDCQIHLIDVRGCPTAMFTAIIEIMIVYDDGEHPYSIDVIKQGIDAAISYQP